MRGSVLVIGLGICALVRVLLWIPLMVLKPFELNLARLAAFPALGATHTMTPINHKTWQYSQ